MTDYVETFEINRHKYGIEKHNHNEFWLWYAGCKIGDAKSMDDARKLLHQYAISQNRAESSSGASMYDKAERTLEKLGGDPFNLGRFRV